MIKLKNTEIKTLINFVADHLTISKKQAKKIIDTKLVYVNKKRVWMAQHKLLPGDVVELPDQTNNKSAKNFSSKVEILFEDEQYLIVNKPAGILSNEANSLETVLKKQLNNSKLLVAHRLDKDTTGCLLVAKSLDAKKRIEEIFREKKVTKNYLAIVIRLKSSIPKTIEIPLDGQYARTDLKVISSNNALSLLRVNITTGRMHQIRKHLSSVGLPILGDAQYENRSINEPLFQGIARQMLHSENLKLINPFTQKPIKAIAPLPKDFKKVLSQFKLRL